MPKRNNEKYSDESNKKIALQDCERSSIDIKPGEILKDICGNEWILGETIGFGGFGVIHHVSERYPRGKEKYVVKIETHTSGGLFTEINCYLRICKKDMIDEWTKLKGLPILGIPFYVASGSHVCNDVKYRFLVLPRYEKDLEGILEEKKKFNLKTVLLISKQILQVLEYIHDKGYIHSDIKAANIMLNQVRTNSKRKCVKSKVKKKTEVCSARYKRYDTRPVKHINYNLDQLFDDYSFGFQDKRSLLAKGREKIKTANAIGDQLYLLDFGLASKYRLSTGEHKNCGDERKAHAGTLLFCSRDAHKGIQSRRSDLESLAYNMVYWLTGSLPWINDLENQEMMQRKKRHCFADTAGFLYFCMPDPPRILKEFFLYIKGLDVQDTPDYDGCQQFITKALMEHGYQDLEFDFENLEGWRLVKKKISEDTEDVFKRPPLLSNMPAPPMLRKKTKKKKINRALKWSRMLSDPEILLKKARDRKDNNEVPNVLDFDLEQMNPTPAMREVFRKYEERKGLSPNSYPETNLGDLPEGYTPAMAAVRLKMLELQELEEAVKPVKKRAKKARKISKKYKNKECRKMKNKVVLPTRTYSLRG